MVLPRCVWVGSKASPTSGERSRGADVRTDRRSTARQRWCRVPWGHVRRTGAGQHLHRQHVQAIVIQEAPEAAVFVHKIRHRAGLHHWSIISMWREGEVPLQGCPDDAGRALLNSGNGGRR